MVLWCVGRDFAFNVGVSLYSTYRAQILKGAMRAEFFVFFMREKQLYNTDLLRYGIVVRGKRFCFQ